MHKTAPALDSSALKRDQGFRKLELALRLQLLLLPVLGLVQ